PARELDRFGPMAVKAMQTKELRWMSGSLGITTGHVETRHKPGPSRRSRAPVISATLRYNGSMEELANKAIDLPGPQPKSNRGWFKRGDGRINRSGRPPKIPSAHGFAKQSDQLKLLEIPIDALLRRLKQQNAPWITNFPSDLTIVDAYLNPT